MSTRREFLVLCAVAATGATASAAHLNAQARTVSVKRFGASGDGTADDSTAIQAAIDEAALMGGADVSVPAGVYPVHGLRLRSRVRLLGAGRGRTLLLETTGGSYLLSVNPGTEGSADPSQNERDIEIAGITFEGPVARMGFAEHQHLLNFNGVTRLHLHDCAIKGFRGDGVFLGSGNVAGLERHNLDVRLSGNHFDGVNCDNRNGISVIDGEGVVISNNLFVRCSRPTMPGPIDIEPDGYPFQRIRNIAIEGNRFEDCGGNVAKISIHVPVPEALAEPIGRFRIAKNLVGGKQRSGSALYVRVFGAGAGKSTRITASAVEIVDNVVSHGSAALQGVNGFVIERNQFRGLIVGAIRTDQPEAADGGMIALNTLHRPSARDAALVIGRARHVIISRNRFEGFDKRRMSGPAVLLQGQGGIPMFAGVTFVENVFADDYRLHVVSSAAATKAHAVVAASNRTRSGKPVATLRIQHES